jgi:hypothetical protein
MSGRERHGAISGILFAARGACVGATDAIAAYPTRDPHDPSDLVATVYHLLGVPADTVVRDQLGRPYPLITGRKIDALLG